MNQKVFIYGLVDPRTNEIRYVGKTNDLKRRFAYHLCCKDDIGSHRYNWIQGLRKKNLKPERIIIEDVLQKDSNKREIFWIAYFRKQVGNKLTNIRDGGDGTQAGWKHTKEALKKISNASKGHTLSLEARKKISESKKGQIVTKEAKHNMSLGQKEHYKKLSKKEKVSYWKRMRDKLTPETQALLAFVRQGTITSKNKTSRYVGVSFCKDRKNQKCKWLALIHRFHKPIFLGRFKTELEAAKRYDEEAVKIFGKDAKTNF